MSACVKCGYNPDAQATARWEFSIPRAIKSLNRATSNRGGRSKSARAAQRKHRDELAAWMWYFRLAARTNGIGPARGRRRVTLTRIMQGRERPFDRDNLAGGCKVVVDAMVHEHLLVDDKPALAEIHYAQERGGKAGLHVLLEELAP